MFKKILEFLKKLGFGKTYSSTWKGKGTGDYNTAEYGEHEKQEDHSDESEE